MADIKSILTNMALFAIISFGIFAFIIITQTDNHVSIKITNDSRINDVYLELNSTFISSQTLSSNSLDSFGNVTPSEQYGTIDVTSIVSPTRIAKAIIIGFWNIFIKLPQSVLGVNSMIAGIISSILIILIIIGIWAIWKGVIN